MFERENRNGAGIVQPETGRLGPAALLAVVAVLVMVAVLALGACAGTGGAERDGNGTVPSSGNGEDAGSGTAEGSGPELAPVAAVADDLRELLVDVAAARACGFMEGRFLTLSGAGASSSGGDSPAGGNLLIRECSASRVDPQHLRIEFSGIGWMWIAREQQQVGAEFEIAEIVTFGVDVGVTGTFDLAYDAQDSILTLWFVPTEPVAAEFDVTGEVQVDTEGLWSSIVGTAATIIGQSPEQRAESTIQQRGAGKFESRLSRGISIVLDLCTGRQYMSFGTLPEGRLPETAGTAGETSIDNGTARLHPNGLLLLGPYPPSTAVTARIDRIEGGGVRAALICAEEARALAAAYVSGNPLPEVTRIGEETIRPEGTGRRLGVAASVECSVVLFIRPIEDQDGPISFSYTVSRPGGGPQPFAPCGE